MSKQIADVLVRAGAAIHNAYPVTVDYGQPFDQMIAEGTYGFVNVCITSANFPITGTGVAESEIVLVHFNRGIMSDDAAKEMEQMGLRPVTLPELLAFGAMYPDMQCEFPVIALDSIWADRNGNRNVPCLCGWRGRRSLYLLWRGWCGGHWRFAAIRT